MPRRTSIPAAPLIDPLADGELNQTDPDRLGETADVDGACFTDVRRAELDLAGERLVETLIRQVDVPVVKAARGQWRDVRIETGRLGSVEAYDISWRSVHLVGVKIGYLNLRGAQLLDVLLTDCQIDELDLGQAGVRRLALPGTRLGALAVRSATLTDVDLRGADLTTLERLDGLTDLRGATLTAGQVDLLAPLMASELGLHVAD